MKIRKKQTEKKQTNKKTGQVICVVKTGICVLILHGELYRVSLEILLHDFCTFGIFYFVSSKVMSKQPAAIVELIFFK